MVSDNEKQYGANCATDPSDLYSSTVWVHFGLCATAENGRSSQYFVIFKEKYKIVAF
jgi:hypothetical protein